MKDIDESLEADALDRLSPVAAKRTEARAARRLGRGGAAKKDGPAPVAFYGEIEGRSVVRLTVDESARLLERLLPRAELEALIERVATEVVARILANPLGPKE